MALSLKWITCGNDAHWCVLNTLTLDRIKESGIYIIWHTGNPGRVVYVGQGDVKDRLAAHQRDKRIQAYSSRGTLKVTWATVPAAQRDGVERHLADKWNPLVGDAHPNVAPIAVNSPW